MLCDAVTGATTRELELGSPGGSLHRLDEDLVICLYEYPKVLSVSDGSVVRGWPHISTGQQRSSIIHHRIPIPPFALHPNERMFAVAGDAAITVVRIR